MPVEGYSNFLWVLISAIAIALKIDPVLFTRIVNSVFLIGIIAIFWNLSKDIFSDDKPSAYLSFSIGVLILLSNPATAIHFLSGLETFTYSFFVIATTFLAYKIIKSKNSRQIWILSVLGVLSGLLRPEGFLITIGLFLLILIFFKKYHFGQTTNLIKSFSIFFFIPIAVYMIFRLNYFNEIFPMPFLVKTMTYGGFGNITENFALYYVIPLLFVIVLALYYAKNKIDINISLLSKETKYILYLIIVLVAIICANLIYVNMSLMMNYSQRFFYPSLVLLYFLSSISIVLIIKNINPNLKDIKFSKIISVILVVLLILSNSYFISDIEYTKDYSKALDRAHIPLGKSLEQYAGYNYTVISGDAGAIPYLSKWNFIDLEGLTDVYIAKNHGMSYEYLAKKNPELIILVSGDGSNIDLNTHNHEEVYNYITEKNYTKLSSIKFGKRYYLVPFLKPGIKDYDKIVNTLNEVAKNSKN